MRIRSRIGFLRAFFDRFIDSEYTRGRIDQQQSQVLKSHLAGSNLRDFRDRLFQSPGAAVSFPGLAGDFRLLSLREANLEEFPFLQYVPRSPRQPHGSRRTRCFLGHRFIRNVEQSLRFDLRSLLEPYRIDLSWVGDDLQSTALFDQIIRDIRACHFCIFDTFGTVRHPNVYIEAGIAYALGRPFILCQYTGRTDPAGDGGGFPSDLSGLLRLQYRTYRQLCEQLYFGLPDFLHRQKIR